MRKILILALALGMVPESRALAPPDPGLSVLSDTAAQPGTVNLVPDAPPKAPAAPLARLGVEAIKDTTATTESAPRPAVATKGAFRRLASSGGALPNRRTHPGVRPLRRSHGVAYAAHSMRDSTTERRFADTRARVFSRTAGC